MTTSEFFQSGVSPLHREWTGFWGLIGEHFPVRSSDGALSLEVVNYEVFPGSLKGELCLTWRLIVWSNERIVEVREQPLAVPTRLPTLVDNDRAVSDAQLIEAYTQFLAKLAQELVAHLDKVGFHGVEMPWSYLRAFA